MSLLSDNNKTLEGAQGTMKTAYIAMVKVEDDFKRRKGHRVIHEVEVEKPDHTGAYVMAQAFNLGTDRKDTANGYFACVSDVDGKTATTTNIYYSLLYQDIPHWSASAGFLTSFLGKRIIGIDDENSPLSNPPVDNRVFAVTDRAQVQLVPMAFVNYRIPPYTSSITARGKRANSGKRRAQLEWTRGVRVRGNGIHAAPRRSSIAMRKLRSCYQRLASQFDKDAKRKPP